MPKIIENLESRILKTAGALFYNLGYDQVSMRMLADELSIAPGTIYNYFSNKEEIFTRIFAESWQRTEEQLGEITRGQDKAGLDLEAVSALYWDMKRRREVLNTYISSEWRLRTFGEDSRKSMKEFPVGVVRTMFARLMRYEVEDVNERDSVVFLHAVRGCLAHYGGEDRKNIEYLLDLFRMIKARYL